MHSMAAAVAAAAVAGSIPPSCCYSAVAGQSLASTGAAGLGCSLVHFRKVVAAVE